ncbi:hypothetical protein [Phyllobacterium meliloti]|uniref:hypothetical protein n=1 Tax=Phyllobacterium meliloti TaxID=555317 RepID=UPI001D144C9E|nr:hypothetical protein [Phyllobacterium sp. T1293]UGX87127.1 hypothetical protein LLE53_004580 [Phyllobacterium sp. T1293]
MMEHANIFVGHRDRNLDPVVEADGKLLGTVQQVKDFIAQWENQFVPACTCGDFERRVIDIIRKAKQHRQL